MNYYLALIVYYIYCKFHLFLEDIKQDLITYFLSQDTFMFLKIKKKEFNKYLKFKFCQRKKGSIKINKKLNTIFYFSLSPANILI